MDLIDKHRTFLFLDELEGGDRNPPTKCRNNRFHIVTTPDQDLILAEGGLVLTGFELGGQCEEEELAPSGPGIQQIGRFDQVTLGWNGEAGAFNRFEALVYPEFKKSRTMVTWERQNFEAFCTMWEALHSPLTFKNSQLTPVVDESGLVIGYFQQGVSTKTLWATDQGELYYSNQYGSHLLGLHEVGGKDLWLSAAGKVIAWSESSMQLSSRDYAELYHEKIPGGNKADILVDIDGYVIAINIYIDPSPMTYPGLGEVLLGFIVPEIPKLSQECMPGGSREGSDECAEEHAQMVLALMDWAFLFVDLFTLGTSRIVRKVAIKLLQVGSKTRRVLQKGAAQLALKGSGATRRASRLLLEPPKMNVSRPVLNAGAPAGKRAKLVLAAEKSGKKGNLQDVAHKSGMTNMAVRDVRYKMTKHGARIRFRPASNARKLRKRGAIPKPEELKMKTIQLDDLAIGAPKEGLNKPGYFDPKLPDAKIKETNPKRYEQLMARYDKRKKEFKDLAKDVDKLTQEGKIHVENGVVKPTTDPQADFTGDYDIFEILDKNGKRISPTDPRYERIYQDMTGRRIEAQHRAHVDWVTKDAKEAQAKADIIEDHRSKTPLYEFREDGSVWEVFAD